MAEDKFYVDYVIERKKESDDAISELKKQWRELWQLYQNKQDFSNKFDWQSKCFVPKIFMEIEKSAGEVKRAVIQPKKLFKLELNDQAEQEQIQVLNEQIVQIEGNDPEAADQIGALRQQVQRIESILEVRSKRMVQRERAFKRELEKSNLANIYSLMIKAAFLLGIGVPKILWDSKKRTVKYENTDAFNISISPSYMPFQEDRPEYIIERQEMPLARLRKLGREKGPYRKSQIKKVEDDVQKMDERAKANQRRGLSEHSSKIRSVEILQFWGDIVHDDDNKIEENMLLVVANGKYLIRKQKNPFSHQLPPHVPTMPIPYPHRGQAGISLVQPMAKLQYAYNNIINMWLDNLNFTVNKVFQINASNLQNPKELTAIYPGKRIFTQGDAPAVSEVPVTPLKRDSFYVLSQIDREMQEGTSVNESIKGIESKKQTTLGEKQLNAAQSKGFFEIIGRDIEQNSLKKVLEMSYDLCSQFLGWEPREGNYTFVVGGLSLILTQQQLTQSLGETLGLALQAPPIGQMTDIEDLWRRYLTVYNLQDAFKETDAHGQEIRPEQAQAIQSKAEQDAKATVLRMSPEQIRSA